jgi:hypothetical protein
MLQSDPVQTVIPLDPLGLNVADEVEIDGQPVPFAFSSSQNTITLALSDAGSAGALIQIEGCVITPPSGGPTGTPTGVPTGTPTSVPTKPCPKSAWPQHGWN